MIEIIQIHQFKQSYPFGLEKETSNTFVEVIRLINSEKEFNFYEQNLKLFKKQSYEDFIKLDSYILQDNHLQIYYEYEPVSLLMYLDSKYKEYLDLQKSKESLKSQFINRILSNINNSMENVINYLISHKILAVLSIESIAIDKQQKLKYFVDPDFQIIEHQINSLEILNEYYQTEKKKLHIQLEEKFQNSFNTKFKTKKANFIIQGTKLVFVPDEETTRQSSMETIARTPISSQRCQNQNQKVLAENILISEIKERKFDIANILDEKKMQKNQEKIISQTINSNYQRIPLPDSLLKKQFKKSFTIQSNQSQNIETAKPIKNRQTEESKQQKTQRQARQIKNYFENNDDFNKDASFYPEQFIKQDSIHELQGYEDELERQLEDLKRTTIDNIEFQQEISTLYKNQLEGGHNKVKLDYLQPHQLHNLKNIAEKQTNHRMSIDPGFIQTYQESIKPHIKQAETITCKKMENQAKIIESIVLKKVDPNSNLQKQRNFGQQLQKQKELHLSQVNTSNSQDHSSQISSMQKKKTKYKVTITTEHEANGYEINEKEIEQQIIQDIKKGTFTFNLNNTTNIQQIKNISIGSKKTIQKQSNMKNALNIVQEFIQKSSNNLHDQGKQCEENYDISQTIMQKKNDQFNQSNGSSLSKKEQIQKILDKIKQSNSKKFEGDIFKRQSIMNEKQSHLLTFPTDQKKILKPLVQPSQQNSYSIKSTSYNSMSPIKQSNQQIRPGSNMGHFHSTYTSSFNNILSVPAPQIKQKSPSNHSIKQEQLGNQSQDKDYLQKIQKAKSKAEQIMRIVKQRKVHQNI